MWSTGSNPVPGTTAEQAEHSKTELCGCRTVSRPITQRPHFADVAVERERSGRPISMVAAQIAAICRSSGVTIVTRLVDDFAGAGAGVDMANPWSDS